MIYNELINRKNMNTYYKIKVAKLKSTIKKIFFKRNPHSTSKGWECFWELLLNNYEIKTSNKYVRKDVSGIGKPKTIMFDFINYAFCRINFYRVLGEKEFYRLNNRK